MKAIASKDALNKSKTQANIITMILSIALLVVIMMALFSFLHVSEWEQYDKVAVNRVAEQRVLSQQIAKYALAASKGEKVAFNNLKKSRDKFARLLKELREGKEGVIKAAPEVLLGTLNQLEQKWNKLRDEANIIVESRTTITAVDEWISEIVNELMPKLEKYSNVVAKGMALYAEPRQIYYATQQLMLAQRIQHNVKSVLEGGQSTEKVLKKFTEDTKMFGRILDGMLVGDEEFKLTKVDSLNIKDQRHLAKLKQSLGNVSMSFSTFKEFSERIIKTAPKVIPALKASSKMTSLSDQIDAVTEKLLSELTKSPGRYAIGTIKVDTFLIRVLGGIAVLLLLLLGGFLNYDSRQREKNSEEMSQRQQKAILRLMDEMDDLADGDLTFHCTVTEDDTGAIADAINNAIETLRRLVSTINNTSDQVTSSAQESRATALHLAEASEHQTQQISAASQAVQNMAKSIETVSTDALETAKTAEQSFTTASIGAEKVRSTIQGMDSIREQIQETSKRIKRLGESSQEIGDIVELIDDIADQTNILALNAAMQAAMAGDAGRGFAVVADEVQRLAERSGNATKQIEALVKAIQADTNEAVASMELSTAGVVNGAKLAEDAGEALQEIENMFKRVADLTQRISEVGSKQSDEAANISETMNIIQEITKQTSEGTNQTSRSIERLADLADDLQKSVSGFRLPA